MAEKNVVSSVMESVAVEFGLDDAYEKAQNLKMKLTAAGYSRQSTTILTVRYRKLRTRWMP